MTVCGAVPYKVPIRLLVVEVYMDQMSVRLVYIESVDVLTLQIYMAKLKQLFVLPVWV